MRFSQLCAGCCCAATPRWRAAALILGLPLTAAAIGAAGLDRLGVIGWRLVGFGRLMHRIIEAVAKQAG